MKKSILLLVVSILAVYSDARATTVIPPSFDELVDRAETILQGTVTEVKPQWTGEGAERHIVTYVTFKVEEALKGTPGPSYTIRMFGGEIEGEGMAIADAPQFQVGDKEIVFIENNGSQIIPLVGMMYGRFHVRQDETGREVITSNQDLPLKTLANLGHEADETASAKSAADLTNAPYLTPADLKTAVKKHLQDNANGHPAQ